MGFVNALVSNHVADQMDRTIRVRLRVRFRFAHTSLRVSGQPLWVIVTAELPCVGERLATHERISAELDCFCGSALCSLVCAFAPSSPLCVSAQNALRCVCQR